MGKATYQSYREQSVMTMTTVEMLTLLYDGILKEVSLVKKAFGAEPRDYSAINNRLQKVHIILNHLKYNLDMKYDVAKNLFSLYDYFSWIVIQANTKKDPSRLDEIIDMVGELKESYKQADKKVRMHA